MSKHPIVPLLFACLFAVMTRAAETVNLSDPQAPTLGWTFDNGREFPGAKGTLTVQKQDGKDVLVLDGDFTAGGNYVQMARPVNNVDIDTLNFRYKSDGANVMVFRIIDATGQCHQIFYRIKETSDWQQVQFPLRRFFENKGKPGAIGDIIRYENWGGANDSKWHGPAKLFVIIAGKFGESKVRHLEISDIQAMVRQDDESSTAAQSAESPTASQQNATIVVKGWVSLLDAKDAGDWSFDNGREFKGAKGGLKILQDQPEKGQTTLQLTGDFSGGGAYVETKRGLKWMGVDDLDTLRFRVRSSTTGWLTLQLVDGTGQCHQNKSALKFPADGEWHDVELPLSKVVGTETWGGANDHKWHGAPRLISVIISKPNKDADKPQIVEFADISVRSVLSVVQQASAYEETFETAAKLPAGWQTQGDVAVTQDMAFEGKHALRISRTLENLEKPVQAVGPAFPVAHGNWSIGAATRCDLNSPDNSFKGVLAIQLLDASDKIVDQITLADDWRVANWKPIKAQVVVPNNVTQARFFATLEKTHGSFWIDNLSASYMAPANTQEARVLRIVMKTAALGNLLLPGQSANIDAVVETGPELPADARTLTYIVTDYWGAEQCKPRTAALIFDKKGSDGRRIYKAQLNMDGVNFDIGRYYEIHVSIPESGGQTSDEFTTLAYLPEAIARKYSWKEIPFSSRNWDNRIGEYIELTDRLGIRLVGIWGGWHTQPPYAQGAPQIDLARKLGLAVLISTPSQAIEHHRKDYQNITPESLTEGAKVQVQTYAKGGPMAITMGNEPPDVPGRAEEAVAAYKALYTGYKAADPNILCVGTSVGTVESYFAAGMGKYLDVYDFHTYDDVGGIRKTFERYHELFAKYGNPKPIWSTETGLNSQGVERRAVAGDMIRKLSTFFACGGANISWFGLLYPDASGKETGSASDAHNVFNCKYNCYAPKLDAISYYNMVNAICIKKFVAEKDYGNVHATLFRDADGRCLQVLWNNEQSVDVFVPLRGVQAVKRILIDGAIESLDADNTGVTVNVGEDPILLLYDNGPATLPDALGTPVASIARMPSGMVKGEPADVAFHLAPDVKIDQVQLIAPPFWTVSQPRESKDDQGRVVTFTVTSPQHTAASAGRMELTVNSGEKIIARLAFRQPVRGAMSVQLLPLPIHDRVAGVRIVVTNNSDDAQQIKWKVALDGGCRMTNGMLHMESPTPASAYFADAVDGSTTVLGHDTTNIDIPLKDVDPLTSYNVKATVTDPHGRNINCDRVMGGFIAVARADSAVNIDGKPDESAWAKASVISIEQADQFFPLKGLNSKPWAGPEDCSAKVRLLWNDQYLYLAFDIKDDTLVQDQKGGSLWMQDGLQFLIDPGRGTGEQSGKYDITMGIGTEGPQAWCHLTASPSVPNGLALDILYAQSLTGKAGNRTVEIAIPWARLIPFKPAVGADLGMCIVINDDDHPIRNRYMNWFGDIDSKSVKANGDLILTK